jgi:hypothetical protein
VWAITRRKNAPAINAELERRPLPQLRMLYFGLAPSLLALKHAATGGGTPAARGSLLWVHSPSDVWGTHPRKPELVLLGLERSPR